MIGSGACRVENGFDLGAVRPGIGEKPRRSTLSGVDEGQRGTERLLVFVPMHANVPLLLPLDSIKRRYF